MTGIKEGICGEIISTAIEALIFSHFTASICVINLEQLRYHICSFPCHNRSGSVGPPLSELKKRTSLAATHSHHIFIDWPRVIGSCLSLSQRRGVSQTSSWNAMLKKKALRVFYSFYDDDEPSGSRQMGKIWPISLWWEQLASQLWAQEEEGKQKEDVLQAPFTQ